MRAAKTKDSFPSAWFIFVVRLCRWFSYGVCAGSAMIGNAQSLALDGQTDLIWHHRRTGQAAIWYMHHASFTWHVGEIQASGTNVWQLVSAADFNRDGAADLLWHNSADRSNAIWIMRGTERLAIAHLPASAPDYQVVGAGDFDNDGYEDILWRNPAETKLAIWFMRGTNYAERVGWLKPPTDTHWTAAVVGDCNLDGFADLFWRNRRTGENRVWLIHGTNVMQELEVAPEPDLGFELIGAGRFTRAGHLDLIWHHQNGTNVVWLMQGPSRRAVVGLPSVNDRDWFLAGTCGYTNSMMLSASVSNNPPLINLHWQPGFPRPKLKRKTEQQPDWHEVQSEERCSQWTDTHVQTGSIYEYQAGHEYLVSGIDVPPIHQRGRVLLLVDETLSRNRNVLAAVRLLETNLVGDGWALTTRTAPRHDDEQPKENPARIAAVKSWIVQFHRDDPRNTNLVFILGHVAIPQSGLQASDGHVGSPKDPTAGWKDHQGAWSADGYYADVESERWTDSQVSHRNSGFPECENLPGDGRFDNDFFPTDIELGVGRVDFARLPCFQQITSMIPKQRETDLLVQYLQKDHRYRQGELSFLPRLLVGTYFQAELYNGSVLAIARRHASRWFGTQPDSLTLGDPFVEPGNYLAAMMAGNGSYQSIEGSGQKYRLAWEASSKTHQTKAAIYLMQGSFFADWNLRSNNLLRGMLAAPDHGLAAVGYSCAVFDFHAEHLGMGESLGSDWKRNVNRMRPQAHRWLALLGDPALRLQITPPPHHLTASDQTQVNLRWQAPPGGFTSYWVLRSTNNLSGPWTLLTPQPITSSEFADTSAPARPLLYQVKALRRVITGSGSFTNTSQAAFCHVEDR